MRSDSLKLSILKISKDVYNIFRSPFYPTKHHPSFDNTRLITTISAVFLSIRGYTDFFITSWRMPPVLILYILYFLAGTLFTRFLVILAGRTKSPATLSIAYFRIMSTILLYTSLFDLAVYFITVSTNSLKVSRFLIPLADIIFVSFSIYFIILCGYTFKKFLQQRHLTFFLSFIFSIIIMPAALFFLVKTFCLDPTIAISSKSMFPTLQVRNYILVNRLAYLLKEPERGEIVLFSLPGEKRSM